MHLIQISVDTAEAIIMNPSVYSLKNVWVSWSVELLLNEQILMKNWEDHSKNNLDLSMKTQAEHWWGMGFK